MEIMDHDEDDQELFHDAIENDDSEDSEDSAEDSLDSNDVTYTPSEHSSDETDEAAPPRGMSDRQQKIIDRYH